MLRHPGKTKSTLKDVIGLKWEDQEIQGKRYTNSSLGLLVCLTASASTSMTVLGSFTRSLFLVLFLAGETFEGDEGFAEGIVLMEVVRKSGELFVRHVTTCHPSVHADM